MYYHKKINTLVMNMDNREKFLHKFNLGERLKKSIAHKRRVLKENQIVLKDGNSSIQYQERKD
jgi:hypothetical protein